MSLSAERASTGSGKTRNTASVGKLASKKSSRQNTDAPTTATGLSAYDSFIDAKTKTVSPTGFDPGPIDSHLFPWQSHVVAWAIRQGRAALFEDCGLGKTLQELEWARQVVAKTNGPVLILTPLAVSGQTLREAQKFGIDAVVVATGEQVTTPRIYITNYEKLEHFDTSVFSGVVLDESSILKSFDGKTRRRLTSAFAQTPYRLCGTAWVGVGVQDRGRMAGEDCVMAAPLWKGEPHKKSKARELEAKGQFISAMRVRLFAEEERCYNCNETQDETARRFFRNGWYAPSEHHMDEIKSRAQTRGEHYTVRFARENVRRACPTCHMKRHGISTIKGV